MSKDISVEKKKNFPFSNEISAWFKDIDMNYVVQYLTIAIFYLP